LAFFLVVIKILEVLTSFILQTALEREKEQEIKKKLNKSWLKETKKDKRPVLIFCFSNNSEFSELS
jgi:hypothetical protein